MLLLLLLLLQTWKKTETLTTALLQPRRPPSGCSWATPWARWRSKRSVAVSVLLLRWLLLPWVLKQAAAALSQG